MVEEAVKTIGWSDKNNTAKTPVHVWYEEKFGNPDTGKYAWDWCDAWITYIAHKSGNAQVVCFGDRGFAYTVAHANTFKVKSQWHEGAAGIRRGDIAFFNWGQGIEHVGLVLSVDDEAVRTIEGNTLNVVDCRNREPRHIAGYGRPKYVAGGPVTPPTTTPAPYKAPPFPTGLAPNSARPSARGLQKALKDGKYLAASVAYADNYGPATQAAVAAFYRAHPALSEAEYDPEIGPKGWATLHTEVYGKKVTNPGPTQPPVTSHPSAAEPPHDYRRVTYGGRTVNVRTQTMLRRAQVLLSRGTELPLTQGSYNRGVSASAGTHDGGGVVDINVSGLNHNAVVRALREAGFAAWLRTPAEGFSYHIHACAIGDREMAPGARNQVRAYFNGRNGLANNRADSAPASVGRPVPRWADKYR